MPSTHKLRFTNMATIRYTR